MLLAVAGLSAEEIKKRTEQLASGDWSSFPASEQVAFQFAYKIARKPASITNEDIQPLLKTFGDHRTIDLIWYGAWCNYMTRVADAFQFPLEQTNIFAKPTETKKE